jgi:hypothetical protein
MPSLVDRRLGLAACVFVLIVAACTSTPPPTAPPPSPAAARSPSPAAQTTPTAQTAPQPVGGGAAQPRAAATSQPIGGSAAIIVPTPNFATNPTNVPAAFAPAVSLATVGPGQVPAVTGTLSRIPTAIPVQGQSQTSAIATATAVAGGGGVGQIVTGLAAAADRLQQAAAGGAQAVPVVQTATPVVRFVPPTQPAITFPGR